MALLCNLDFILKDTIMKQGERKHRVRASGHATLLTRLLVNAPFFRADFTVVRGPTMYVPPGDFFQIEARLFSVTMDVSDVHCHGWSVQAVGVQKWSHVPTY